MNINDPNDPKLKICLAKMAELSKQGYKWDKSHSVAAAGVVYTKGKDFWLFSLDGEIIHNPEPLLKITL